MYLRRMEREKLESKKQTNYLQKIFVTNKEIKKARYSRARNIALVL
jgi:hypothetical protein